MVRRIDDLGRVVIPKELRRVLRFREGDPLEIFTNCEGEIILKKYSPICELESFVKDYTESLAQNLGHIVCIVDKDKVIAVSGVLKKQFLEKHISEAMEKTISQRNIVIVPRIQSKFIPILQEGEAKIYKHELITPITSEGYVLGAIIFLSDDKNMGELEVVLAQTASEFLGKQMKQ